MTSKEFMNQEAQDLGHLFHHKKECLVLKLEVKTSKSQKSFNLVSSKWLTVPITYQFE